jgi:hypothetical protein
MATAANSTHSGALDETSHLGGRIFALIPGLLLLAAVGYAGKFIALCVKPVPLRGADVSIGYSALVSDVVLDRCGTCIADRASKVSVTPKGSLPPEVVSQVW